MGDIRHRFDLEGLSLVARGPNRLVGFVRELLQDHVSALAGPAGQLGVFHIEAQYGAPAQEAGSVEGMRQVWAGELADGSQLVCYGAEGVRRMDLLGRATFSVDLRSRSGRLTVATGREAAIALGCFIPMLCEILAGAGQHFIHAACLAAEAGGSQRPGGRRAVLLTGPSGHGKTTSALALAKAGMTFLSDDVTFLCEEDGALRVWGIRLPLKVCERTFDLLPWCGDFVRQRGAVPGEFVVNPRDLFGPQRPSAARPVAIVLLAGRSATEHVIEPARKTEALVALAGQNVRCPDAAWRDPGGDAFRLMARLVSKCRTCSLRVGPDVGRLAEHVVPLLEEDGQ